MEAKQHRRIRSAKKRSPKSKLLKQLRRKSLHNDCNPKYYGTDEEDYTYQSVHRYSSTSFPLFSNKSDDEAVQTSRRLALTNDIPRRRSHYRPLSAAANSSLSSLSRINSSSQPNISTLSVSGIDLSLRISKPVRTICTRSSVRGRFPFQTLPYDLKMKIFTYLNHLEKGVAMTTCHEWYELLQSPSLWSTVLLSDFPMSCIPSANHEPLDNCYPCYKHRVGHFCNFLIRTQPIIKKLEFKFDICEDGGSYLVLLKKLFAQINLRELQSFHFNWKDTPARPYWFGDSKRWTRDNDLVYHHKRRSRLFTYFFDEFSQVSQKLTTLVLPFDWRGRSVESFTRLTNLHSLVLEKYFVFQSFKQEHLDQLLLSLPNLKRLLMEIWTPSGLGLIPFSIASQSIEYLDISQSRGFHVHKMDLPKLKQIIVTRHPWNGPLVCRDRVYIPCLYGVLIDGTPELCRINDHDLLPDWKYNVYPDLEKLLKSVCSCQKHKTGWAM